jgi:hypothetical protein
MTGSISLLSPLRFVVAEPSRRAANPSRNLTGATLLDLVKMLFRIVRQDTPGLGPMDFRTEDASLMVIDHEQPMRGFRVGFGRDRLRLFEKVAQRHDVPIFRDILCVRLMQDERLPIARRLEVPIGLFRDLAKLL